jgi:hypothetical protein
LKLISSSPRIGCGGQLGTLNWCHFAKAQFSRIKLMLLAFNL